MIFKWNSFLSSLEDLLCQTEKIWVSFRAINYPDFPGLRGGFWDAGLSSKVPGKSRWVGHPSPSPGSERDGGFQGKKKIKRSSISVVSSALFICFSWTIWERNANWSALHLEVTWHLSPENEGLILPHQIQSSCSENLSLTENYFLLYPLSAQISSTIPIFFIATLIKIRIQGSHNKYI